MEIIELEGLKKLKARDNHVIKIKGDNYIEGFINERGEEIPEYYPMCYDSIYIPNTYTIEEAKRDYEELLLSDYPWKVTEINSDSIEVLWEDALLSGLK